MKNVILFLLCISFYSTTLIAQTTVHSADFESGLNGWTQSAADNFDFTRTSGGTPSSGTGPSSASSGSFYLFTEASSPQVNGDIAIITSPVIDLTSYINPQLTFDYHMYTDGSSSDVGSLDVEINVNGSGWGTNIFSRSGYQNNQATWLNAVVNLTAYQGNSIQLRVIVTRANSYRSDIAIDNIEVTGTLANVQEINITGLGNTISDGDLTPSATDGTNFGSVSSGFSFDRTFTIYNTGNATADISISNNDSNENPYNFRIQGTGVVPLTAGPGGITTDLQLWLKANDGLSYSDGQSVQLWADQGRGTDATTNLPAQAPTYRDNIAYNVNFNPVVDFDNDYNNVPVDYTYNDTSRQFLKGASGFYSQDIFVVVIPDATVTSSLPSMDTFCADSDTSKQEEDATGIGLGRYTVRFSGEVITYAIGTTSSGDGYGIAEISATASYNNVGIINSRNNLTADGVDLYYNALNIGNTENDPTDFSEINNANYWIGRSEGWKSSLDGRVCEIVTFSSRQNDASERKKIESYLAIKYGITLGVNGTSQDYVDSNGNVIWDVSANSGFNYDIAGIGLDNNSELNQKQSKSVNSGSLVAIGLEQIALTNNLNSGVFNTDRDFLVWGNNNGSFSVASQTSRSINLSGSITTFTPVAKKWKIVESQNDVPEVMVSIPTSSLTSSIPLAANEEYVLIVADNSNFNNNDIIDVIPLKVNGSNSEVWYDFDTTKYFTYGKASRVEEKRQIDFATNEFLLADSSLELTNTFTVSAWIKSNGAAGSFISKGNNGYNFKINASNLIEIDWNGSTQITSSNSINNLWHHIALTFSAGTANLYIDGILDRTVSGRPNPTTTNNKFAIGALYTDKNNISSFNGSVDEVRIWTEALTVSEIRYIMNQEIEQHSDATVNGEIIPQNISKNDIKTKNWTSLNAYYDMNSFYGTTVEDNSNNKNWARIKYLTKDKQLVENQTAPLPYQSTNSGNWDTSTTWLNNTVQYLPNTTLNGTQVDWNIVEINNNVNTTRGITVLGLLSNSNELSINSDNHLTISHYLLLNGSIDLDGESQLIQTLDSDLDATSTGYLERDQQGEGNKFRYNDWSSPVVSNFAAKTYTVASVLNDGTNPSSPSSILFVAGYDGNIGPPIEIANHWIYKYANDLHDNYSRWNQIGSTGLLLAGEGFLMKGPGDPGSPDQNYVFIGMPNNGDITLQVNDDNDYLVGNPYPSAIDADQFITDNASTITGTLYFWEHYGGDTHNLKEYQAGYATYNYSGGVSTAAVASPHPITDTSAGNGSLIPQKHIAVGQGFFVQGNSTAGAKNIVFKNNQRAFVTEVSTNSVFLKSEKANKTSTQVIDNRIKIRIGMESETIDHRQLLLTIDERASDAVDWGFDGEIYEILDDDMYWLIDAKKYVIQATDNLELNKEIPLGIKSNGGEITIKIDQLQNFSEEFDIYLKDVELNTYHNLSESNYTINLPEGEYENKFVVTLKEANPSNIEGSVFVNGDELTINFEKQLGLLTLINNQLIHVSNISLYNTLGQLTNYWNVNSNNSYQTFSINSNTGIYIVQITTEKGSISKKLLIN